MPLDLDVAIIFGSMLLALFASLLYAYWYQSLKHKRSGGREVTGAESIRLSELEEAMQRAVSEATLPLVRRLEALESEVQLLQPPEGMSASRGQLQQHEKSVPELPAEGLNEDAEVLLRQRIR